ncbi:uncharacterized protein ACRADG_010997 [Cochliomyia hominivorax]
MNLIFLLLSFCYLTSGLQETDIQEKWLNFKIKYGKNYRNIVDDSQRFINFKRNLLKVWQHNQRFKQGLESYEMSLNTFSDMSFKELENSYMGFKITKNDKEILRNSTLFSVPIYLANLPEKVDWRETGAITPVKNQKSCNSCWAFASVAALEAHYYLKYKKRILLSEQNLVDCVKENWGCSGGWMIPSFNYIYKNEGLNPEAIYPYEAVEGECRHVPHIGAKSRGYLVTNPGDEKHLQYALAYEGPVAVAIQANENFMNYKSGIFDDNKCSKQTNHAVLIVGYATENGKDYWLIKNSWGTHWGDNGYIKMARNKNSQCAIADYVSYPVYLKILFVLSFCCFAAALQEAEIQQEWLKFKRNYGKKYRSLGDNKISLKNFRKNLLEIREHNKLYEEGLSSYKMAVNPFTGYNFEDVEKLYMGFKISEQDKQKFLNIQEFSQLKATNLPTSMDWRDRGAISAVKDQKECGSCWAFSSTGALEAHYFLHYNKSVILSEQNLIDCVTENSGCNGGWMIPCFNYVQNNEGLDPETKYPYEAVDGVCRFQTEYKTATCKGYQRVRQDDEQHLLEIVSTVGPVAVAIEVNSNFLKYTEGIYDDPECTGAVNHAVLVIGYGTENGQDYWLVKNSWSSNWGMGGYVKMARNKNNQCGIAKFASYPLV